MIPASFRGFAWIRLVPAASSDVIITHSARIGKSAPQQYPFRGDLVHEKDLPVL
jgi:hypothetical protein